jgi:hypothetical protein
MCEEDPSVAKHVQSEYGGVEALRVEVLRDFFRFGKSSIFFPIFFNFDVFPPFQTWLRW